MAGKRVLEIEQAEMVDALAALDQHDIFGMIVAQHGDRPEPVAGDRLQHLAPRRAIGVRVDLQRRPPGNTSR